MYALRKLTAAEFRLFLREPIVVFFVVAFPAVLVAILGSVKPFRVPSADLGGASVIDIYVTIAITLALTMLALQYTPSSLSSYREKGILKRLSTTPVTPYKLLAAQLINSLLIAVVMVGIVLALGRLAFGVSLPQEIFGYLVALLLTAAALFSIGLFVAAIVPSGKVGNTVGTVLFFPVMFFAGLWVPRESMPAWLQRIGDFTPLGAGEQALRAASTGAWPHAGQLLVLAAYVVAFGVAAAKLFKWE
jgi:ABC-2 type transport system permease protein